MISESVRQRNFPLRAEFLPLMKPTLTYFATALLLLVPAGAIEPQKPLVTLTVKRQLLDSDYHQNGRTGDTRHKTITLRVNVSNTSQTAVGESELSGNALIVRAENLQEMVIKEPLTPINVPAMKPGERLTFDLGEIHLSEIEWSNHKYEETLEEWKVICTQGTIEVGASVSSGDYDKLVTEVVPDSKIEAPVIPLRKPLRIQIE